MTSEQSWWANYKEHLQNTKQSAVRPKHKNAIIFPRLSLLTTWSNHVIVIIFHRLSSHNVTTNTRMSRRIYRYGGNLLWSCKLPTRESPFQLLSVWFKYHFKCPLLKYMLNVMPIATIMWPNTWAGKIGRFFFNQYDVLFVHKNRQRIFRGICVYICLSF